MEDNPSAGSQLTVTTDVTTVERTLSSESTDEDFIDFSRQLTKALADTYTVSSDDLVVRGGNGNNAAAATATAPADPAIAKILERLNQHADHFDQVLQRPPNRPGLSLDMLIADLISGDIWEIDYDQFESTCRNAMTILKSCFNLCRDQIVFIYSSASRVVHHVRHSGEVDTASREQQINGYAARYIQRHFPNVVTSQRGLEAILENDKLPFIDVD